MKRSSGIIVTGLSTALLSTGAVIGSGFLSPDTSTAAATTQASTLDSAASQSTDQPSASSESTASATPDATSTSESTPSETATADASTSTGTDAVSGTFSGSAVQTRYGAFQAEITVENGVITAISWLQEGEADHKSQEINARAIPQLETAILEAQSTDVGYISGASYTSEGVEDAVLSAMQAAGLA